MTPAASKDISGPGYSLGRFARRAGLFLCFSTPVAAVLFGGITAFRATHELSTAGSYAEVLKNDGTTDVFKGRGFFFTNPFKTQKVTEWVPDRQNMYLHRRENKQDLRITAEAAFVDGTDWGVSRYKARNAGGEAVKNLFTQRAWRSFEDVNPETHPENAAAVCAAFTAAATKTLQQEGVRELKVANCAVKVKRDGFTLS